ncbi:MAG: hypothetical protein Q9185_004023 [Variospora sp. 1 TL-2023]
MQVFFTKERLVRHVTARDKKGTCPKKTKHKAAAATPRCSVCLKDFTRKGLKYHIEKRDERGGVCPKDRSRVDEMVRLITEEGNMAGGGKEVNYGPEKGGSDGHTFDQEENQEGLHPGEVSDHPLGAPTPPRTPTESGSQRALASGTGTQAHQHTLVPSSHHKGRRRLVSTAKKSRNTCFYPNCSATFATRAETLRHVYGHRQGALIWRHRASKSGGTTRQHCPEGCSARITILNPLRFESHLENRHAWCVICSIPHASLAHLLEHDRVVHRSPTPCCPHKECGATFERYEKLLEHYWSREDHPKVIVLSQCLVGGCPWRCPFCGETRSFESREMAFMHFHRLHYPLEVGMATRDAQLAEESTNVRMANGETQSSMETVVETGKSSPIETGTRAGTSSSMDAYPKVLTYSSIETMSVDSTHYHNLQTDEVPASKDDEDGAQIDRIQKQWGVQLCDNPRECSSCGNLLDLYYE